VVGACSTGGHSVVADSTATSALTSTSWANPPAHPHDFLVMPDLRGMYWTIADPTLRTVGWTGVLSKAPDLTNSQYLSNQIAAQAPAPGQVIANDAVITLQFAR
jgi:serine/threonine-protein kinase